MALFIIPFPMKSTVLSSNVSYYISNIESTSDREKRISNPANSSNWHSKLIDFDEDWWNEYIFARGKFRI